jgi:metal-responsive CopG/Arc/MetJ family transcriptional regulator
LNTRSFCSTMKAELLRKLIVGKSTTLSVRIDPDLLRLVDLALEKDKEFNSRNELIEVLLLRYLEAKGKL